MPPMPPHRQFQEALNLNLSHGGSVSDVDTGSPHNSAGQPHLSAQGVGHHSQSRLTRASFVMDTLQLNDNDSLLQQAGGGVLSHPHLHSRVADLGGYGSGSSGPNSGSQISPHQLSPHHQFQGGAQMSMQQQLQMQQQKQHYQPAQQPQSQKRSAHQLGEVDFWSVVEEDIANRGPKAAAAAAAATALPGNNTAPDWAMRMQPQGGFQMQPQGGFPKSFPGMPGAVTGPLQISQRDMSTSQELLVGNSAYDGLGPDLLPTGAAVHGRPFSPPAHLGLNLVNDDLASDLAQLSQGIPGQMDSRQQQQQPLRGYSDLNMFGS
jgi:hypothetical protein